MNECVQCWSYYTDAMALARRTADPAKRKILIREAYTWLQRYFDAEEREVRRLERLLAR